MPLTFLRVLCGVSAVWAIGALTAQLYRTRVGERPEFSVRRGDPLRGILHIFTRAMMPTHKESARHHMTEFVVGLGFHVGAILALAAVLLLVFVPRTAIGILLGLRPLFQITFLMGLGLLSRRVWSNLLRALSTPDDYLAIGASCGLLLLAMLAPAGEFARGALLLYATALFIYIPLGKLRHMAFFFAARADLGRRLGYRGVYPPATPSAEQSDVRSS